jgi:putative phage-type endonuclease
MQILTETTIEQRTEDWHQQRLGKVTASRVADAVARTKSGWGAARGTYLIELVVERLTGEPVGRFTSAAMEWGTEMEPHARLAYVVAKGCVVDLAGFVDHPTIPMSGASPDGFVGDDGLLEVKCPNTATHIKTLLGEPIDADYIKQMQWQMSCTGRKWCDFVSYDPRLPEDLQLFVKRVARDDAMIAELEKDVRTFLAEVDAKIEALCNLTAVAA